MSENQSFTVVLKSKVVVVSIRIAWTVIRVMNMMLLIAKPVQQMVALGVARMEPVGRPT